jgi:hypothetical protein
MISSWFCRLSSFSCFHIFFRNWLEWKFLHLSTRKYIMNMTNILNKRSIFTFEFVNKNHFFW